MKSKGFTLIEVLVALAIVSIALTAMLKAFSQNINSLSYLQDKVSANEVATNVINQIQLQLLTVDAQGQTGEQELLGKKWHWQATLQASKNPHIAEIDVNVTAGNKEDSLIHLKTFILNSDLKENHV